MEVEAYKEAILGKLDAVRDHMSMCEVIYAVEAAGGVTKGDIAMEHPKYANLFMWVNASPELLDAINALLAAKQMHYARADMLTYVVDGMLLGLPIAGRRPPKDGYKKPRWLPIVFRPGPGPEPR